jgi:soluble lytic murein transglycosylase-like protein
MEISSNLVFDDESLVRIFVRIRSEHHKSDKCANTIYNALLSRTSYRLPTSSILQEQEKSHALKRISSDLKMIRSAHYESEREQKRMMNFNMEVVQPAMIVYTDATSGLQIPYEEYERRYSQYCIIKRKLSRADVYAPAQQESFFSEESSPCIVKRRRVTLC